LPGSLLKSRKRIQIKNFCIRHSRKHKTATISFSFVISRNGEIRYYTAYLEYKFLRD